jgi:hypothetical protein
MKKILIALSVGFASLTALSNCVYAQNSENPFTFNDAKIFKSSVRNLTTLESPALMSTYAPDTKNINARAIKDFQSRFNNTANALWFSDQKSFMSYFVKDGYGNRVYYDKKGRWQYSLLFYGENKLSRKIRAIVKSVYFDLAITLVEEVQTYYRTGYVIHLEDKSNIKIVKVNQEGEMEILQEFVKQ